MTVNGPRMVVNIRLEATACPRMIIVCLQMSERCKTYISPTTFPFSVKKQSVQVLTFSDAPIIR